MSGLWPISVGLAIAAVLVLVAWRIRLWMDRKWPEGW